MSLLSPWSVLGRLSCESTSLYGEATTVTYRQEKFCLRPGREHP